MTAAGGRHGGGTGPMSHAELVEWLRGRLDDGAPAALVRFGDGEGKLLVAEQGDEGSMRLAVDKLGRETGRPFTPDEALEVKALVAFAFDEADLLGIGYGDRFVEEHKAWMDRLAAIYAERVAAGRQPARLAHCLFSHDLLGDLPRLLAGRRVSAISCRDIGRALEVDWGVEDVVTYQVPSQHLVRDVDGDYELAMHGAAIWPDVHDRIRSELTVREPGEVFLVGAGLFGKDLCIQVRRKGGIALDMGSALDRLAGKITRGPRRRVLDLYAGGMPVADIAAELRRRYGAEVDPEAISDGLDEAVDVGRWRGRRLRSAYSTVHVATVELNIVQDGAVRSRPLDLAFGARPDRLEPLGFWWQGADATEPLSAIAADLRRRGVRDVPRPRVEGSEGFAAPAVGEVRRLAARAVAARGGRFDDELDASRFVCLAMLRAARR